LNTLNDAKSAIAQFKDKKEKEKAQEDMARDTMMMSRNVNMI